LASPPFQRQMDPDVAGEDRRMPCGVKGPDTIISCTTFRWRGSTSMI